MNFRRSKRLVIALGKNDAIGTSGRMSFPASKTSDAQFAKTSAS